MSQKTEKTLAVILLLLYLAGVAYCCFGHFDQELQIEKTFLGLPIDKVVHFTMFFPFPILMFLVFNDKRRKPWKNLLIIVVSFIIGCAIGAATEIGQSFTDYRTGDKMDFVADMTSLIISSLMTAVIYLVAVRIKKRKECSEN